MAQESSRRWTTRDVVTFAVFNVLIMAITMVAKVLEDLVLSPQNEFFVGSWLFPLLATPLYLVMADGIGKPGVLAGTTLVLGAIYSLTGGLYCAPVAVVGAVVGELAMRALGPGSYRSALRATVGFYVYWVTFACYGIIPYLLFRDAYMRQLGIPGIHKH